VLSNRRELKQSSRTCIFGEELPEGRERFPPEAMNLEAAGGASRTAPPRLRPVGVAMKGRGTKQASHTEELALFLEGHPSFSPELRGEDAVVWGFRVGACFLTLGEMERLIATQPHFDARETTVLLAAPEPSARMR
jgi:hypothetical protein